MSRAVEANRAFVALDVVRVFLGAALFVRGLMFMKDGQLLYDLAPRGDGWFWSTAVAHYVGFAHLVGGLFLAVGLLPRIAALVQIPVLFGAVAFVHWEEGLLAAGQSLELAALVLVLLVAFAIVGAGPLSVQHLLNRRADEIERAREELHPDEWYEAQSAKGGGVIGEPTTSARP